jgi:putative addiction module component (TIGR02574 family)
MASVFDEVAAKAKQLSSRERARLIEELIRSLEGEPEGTPEETAAAWDAEIARRVDDMEAGRVEWVSHEQFMAEVRATIEAARAK